METVVENSVVSSVDTTDTTILNKDSYSTLDKMLRSRDVADHRVAQAILNQLNIEKSIMFIRMLAKNHSSRMAYLRTKDGRKFAEESCLFRIAYANDCEFAEILNGKGWLHPEYYQELKDGIKKLIQKGTHHSFYDFHITIKDHYRDKDPEDQLTELKDIL